MPVTYQSIGTQSSSTGAISVSWPTGHAVDDIGILVIESGGGTFTTPSGWNDVATSTASGTQLNIYWKRATSTAESAASVTFPTGGDHLVARIATFRGCVASGSPIFTSATSVKNFSSTSWSAPAITTTTSSEFVVWGVSRDNDTSSTTQFGNPVNANLVSPTEIGEGGTASNNGGGFTVGYGVKTTAGNTGDTTGTTSAFTVNASITFSLAPIGTPLSLDGTTGTFALNRFNAGLIKSNQIDATLGTFNLVGNNLILSPGINLDVTVGTFALNGTTIGLLKSNILNNTLGTFTFTGNNLILSPTVALNTTVGAFNLIGNSVDLTYIPVNIPLELICQLGSFTWTGISNILSKQIILNNTTGIFTLDGINLGSAFTYAIIGNTGPFLIGFNSADIAKNFQLISSTGTYTLTGISSDAVKNYPIVALPQSYVVGTTGLDYFSTRRIEASTAPFVMNLQSNGDFFWYQTTQTIPIIKPRLTNRNQWILGRATHMGRRGL